MPARGRRSVLVLGQHRAVRASSTGCCAVDILERGAGDDYRLVDSATCGWACTCTEDDEHEVEGDRVERPKTSLGLVKAYRLVVLRRAWPLGCTTGRRPAFPMGFHRDGAWGSRGRGCAPCSHRNSGAGPAPGSWWHDAGRATEPLGLASTCELLQGRRDRALEPLA